MSVQFTGHRCQFNWLFVTETDIFGMIWSHVVRIKTRFQTFDSDGVSIVGGRKFVKGNDAKGVRE